MVSCARISSGMDPFIFVSSIMDCFNYKNIFKDNLWASVDSLGVGN